jgi:hypothetical protein
LSKVIHKVDLKPALPPQKRVSQLWFPFAKIYLESVGELVLPEPSWLKNYS